MIPSQAGWQPVTDRALEDEEDALRSQVTALEPDARKHYYRLERERIRDPDTYAVLNYFIVGGLHHFYLGKYLFGAINLLAVLVGILTLTSFGLLLIAAVVIIELPQLFRSQSIVRRFNNEVMKACLSEVRASHRGDAIE